MSRSRLGTNERSNATPPSESDARVANFESEEAAVGECKHGKCEGYCPQCGDLREMASRASDGPYFVTIGETQAREVWSGTEEDPGEPLPYDFDDALWMAACTPERIVGLLDALAEAQAKAVLWRKRTSAWSGISIQQYERFSWEVGRGG